MSRKKSSVNVYKKETFKRKKDKQEEYYIAPVFFQKNMDVVKITQSGLFLHNNDYYSFAYKYSLGKNSIEYINNFITDLRITDCNVRVISNFFDDSYIIVVSFRNINKEELNNRVDTIRKNILYSANNNHISLEVLDATQRINIYSDYLSNFFDVDTSESLFNNCPAYLSKMFDEKKELLVTNDVDYFQSDVNHKYYSFVSIYGYPYEFVDFVDMISNLSYIKGCVSEMTPISDYNFIKNWENLYAGLEGLIKRIQRNNVELYEIYTTYINNKKKRFNDNRKFCYLSNTYLIEGDDLEDLRKNYDSFLKIHKSINNSIKLISYEHLSFINLFGNISNEYSISNVLISSSEIGKMLIPYQKEEENDIEMLKNYFVN